jgi:hypothetical protein
MWTSVAASNETEKGTGKIAEGIPTKETSNRMQKSPDPYQQNPPSYLEGVVRE